MKKISFLFRAACFSLLLISCKSTGVTIPGEKDLRMSNIYAEYYNIAEEYSKLKNYKKAVEYYELSMSSKTLRNTAYYKSGVCHVLNGDYTEAASVFKKLLEKDPENLNLSLSLAYVYAQSGDIKKASKLYGELFDENPDIQELLENYIAVLISDNKMEEAEEKLKVLEEKFPDSEKISLFKEKISGTGISDSDKNTFKN